MSKDLTIDDKIKFLRQVASLDDTELGDYLHALCEIYGKLDILLDDPIAEDSLLFQAYAALINIRYEQISTQFKIVETEYTAVTKRLELIDPTKEKA